MQDPVGVEIVDAVQDLVEERLDHVPRNVDLLTFGLARSVELDDMLREKERVIDSRNSTFIALFRKIFLPISHARQNQTTARLCARGGTGKPSLD